MRKLLVVLVVFAGALLAGDAAARSWAESKLAEQAAAYYPQSSGASASIRSFPFLGRLFLVGDVPGVSVAMTGVQADPVLVETVTFDLERVEVDRSELFSGRVRLFDIGRGRIEARIDGPSLARAVGVDVRFSEGSVEIRRQIRGVDVTATAQVSIEGNVVRLTPTSVQGLRVPLESLAVEYRIPGVDIVPCVADARPVAGGLMLSCEIDDIPAPLVRAVGG